ncbi:hypothetical protein GOM44_06510 [Wolbachia endosymbiont of Atemnus politus]|uniref:hypothetical protein n=1 Tax=Wolbachia endosymbiont of Atemnus politus TaxID=2682840 RepID=UPI0019E1252E|nr:hypothetical protein [Wolbachia endosymbiont of Atemnus politus]NSX83828.1 hypothetical protein [Wolbachia endosymbiont of Atemnus politus]
MNNLKLINNLKECLSYLLHDTGDMDVKQQASKNITKLLTSIINDINLSKELLTEHKGTTMKRWKREYDTILRLINEEAHKGNFYTKTQFCWVFLKISLVLKAAILFADVLIS